MRVKLRLIAGRQPLDMLVDILTYTSCCVIGCRLCVQVCE